MVFVAIRGGGVFGGGVLLATVFGLRRVVRIGGVFVRIFLVVGLIMGVLFVSSRADGDVRRRG